MPLDKAKKQEVIKSYAPKTGDTGSAEVQIAIMQARIEQITEPRKHRIAAVKRYFAEEVVKHGAVVMTARLKVYLSHGDLVEVGIARGHDGVECHGQSL